MTAAGAGAYPGVHETFADADQRQELAAALLARAVPVLGADPAWLYLTRIRKLPADVVRRALEHLRVLPAPIEGRPPMDHAVVSLLYDQAGEVSGLQLTFVDILGATTAAEPRRQSYSLRQNGVRDGLFGPLGPTGAVAYITEGRLEKPLALAAAGLGPVYGAGGRPCLGFAVPPEAEVVIVADRRPEGEDGEAHDLDYRRAVDRLLLAGKEVAVSADPPCACCVDADQFLIRHGPILLADWVGSARPVTALSLDGEARLLARIRDPLERDREVTVAARRLGVRVATLREAVRKHHDHDGETEADREAVTAHKVEDAPPWPEPVAGAELLDAIVALLRRHVLMPVPAAHAVALWAVHSHALEQAWFNPRLAICSPVKRCGKTTLIEVLAGLVARAKPSSGVTPAVVFRLIDLCRPTYLIDEADGYLPENTELRSILNSGHTRTSATIDRNVKRGDDWAPKSFSTWCPLVIAGIGRLPGTLDDRSIKIWLERKPRAVRLARFRADRVAGITELGRKLARWALDHQVALGAVDVEPPAELNDRAADNWRPMLGIASIIGGEWPARALAAALALEAVDDDAEDVGVQLLTDTRAVFDAEGKARLASSVIVERLLAMEGRPWPELGRAQRPLTATGMARLLRPFGIRPVGTLRFGATTAKGYRRAAFEAAWLQYCSPIPPSEPSHRHNPANPPGSDDSEPSHTESDVTDANGLETAASLGCDSVTVQTPLK